MGQLTLAIACHGSSRCPPEARTWSSPLPPTRLGGPFAAIAWRPPPRNTPDPQRRPTSQATTGTSAVIRSGAPSGWPSAAGPCGEAGTCSAVPTGDSSLGRPLTIPLAISAGVLGSANIVAWPLGRARAELSHTSANAGRPPLTRARIRALQAVSVGNFGEAPGTRRLVGAEGLTARGLSTGCANRFNRAARCVCRPEHRRDRASRRDVDGWAREAERDPSARYREQPQLPGRTGSRRQQIVLNDETGRTPGEVTPTAAHVRERNARAMAP